MLWSEDHFNGTDSHQLRISPGSAAVRDAPQRVAAAAPRGRFVDLVLTVTTVGIWIAATAILYVVFVPPMSLSLGQGFALACFCAGFVGYVLHVGARGPTAWALRRFAREWEIIEDEDGVVKVVGNVPIRDWEHATTRMLTTRPGLSQVWAAQELYGVPLAAKRV